MELSWKSDKKLKTALVKEMYSHKEQDQIIKGTYGKQNGVWKGCAVGCAIHSLNIKKKTDWKTDDHSVYEKELGIPLFLAYLEDNIFEGLPDKDNSQFAVDFLEAIPVGVNLEPVKYKFLKYLLEENHKTVSALKDIKDDLKKQVLNAIDMCMAVMDGAIKTGKIDGSAASAAWSAASSAAYKKFAWKLIKILKESK